MTSEKPVIMDCLWPVQECALEKNGMFSRKSCLNGISSTFADNFNCTTMPTLISEEKEGINLGQG